MNVSILITTPPGCDPDLCSLTLDTIRVGFPTANVHVTWNGTVDDKIRNKWHGNYGNRMQHHYDWIKEELYYKRDSEEPLILLDGDVIFFVEVESWRPDPRHMFAGHYIPMHLNIFSKCPSVERLHTSFLWIQSPKRLVNAIQSIYKSRSLHERNYLLVDLISPRVSFIRQKPIFHDTTAGLFQAFGGERFKADILNRFFHINSAAFFPEVFACLSPKEQGEYDNVHYLAKSSPNRLYGVWRATDDFYRSRLIELKEYLND